jgi:hypothetical protein
MRNTELRRQIAWGMRRVPKMGSSWRFIPINQMPAGTEIVIESDARLTPGEGEIRELNGLPEEYDVMRLPEGTYRLFCTERPRVAFEGPDGVRWDVSPLCNLLAPSSTFQANLDLVNELEDRFDENWTTTYRLTTGRITRVYIPGTRFTLTLSDDNLKERKYFQRRPKRKRPKPLRNRWR